MNEKRWLRIIPVALIMYTISYIDRTNVSLAFDPKLSGAMSDLGMDDTIKGNAIGLFFWGYMVLQIPGGFLANHWSAKRIVSIFLICWGICAVGCGFVTNVAQFKVMRFLLGVSESGVYPATLVLLANWFPRAERGRANAYWTLCQPLAVAVAAPVTGALLHSFSWRVALIAEGALPFIWLPIWWYYIDDKPSQAKWITPEERNYLETTLAKEAAQTEPAKKSSWKKLAAPGTALICWLILYSVARWGSIIPTGTSTTVFLYASFFISLFWLFWKIHPSVVFLVPVYFFMNCAVYGCNTFLSTALPDDKFSKFSKSLLYAVPYLAAAVAMVLASRHSDKTQERRGHVAVSYAVGGIALILSVLTREYFWISFAFLCLAIAGQFAGQPLFWTIPAEIMPIAVVGAVMGLVNACGNVGGWAGNALFGWLKQENVRLVDSLCNLWGGWGQHIFSWLKNDKSGTSLPFVVLGCALLISATFVICLPKKKPAPVTEKLATANS
jgi:MFS family permease